MSPLPPGASTSPGSTAPVEHVEFANAQTLHRADLEELVRSRSECVILPEEERRPVLERINRLFDVHATDGVLTMPYVTECFRAART